MTRPHKKATLPAEPIARVAAIAKAREHDRVGIDDTLQLARRRTRSRTERRKSRRARVPSIPTMMSRPGSAHPRMT